MPCCQGLSNSECFGCGCIDRCPSIGLAEWFQIMHFNPFYAFTLAQNRDEYPGTSIPAENGLCTDLIYCSGSCRCSNVGGRDDIWSYILRADDDFRHFTGYWPNDHPSCDEWAFKFGYICGRLRLHDSKIKALGKQMLVKLATISITPVDGLGDPLDITDETGDGLLDTVTITLPVQSGVADSELAVFFVEDDWVKLGPCSGGRCRHEIRPISVRRVLNDWEITFPSYVAVRPKLYSDCRMQALDPNDVEIYAPQVDIYRRFADSDQAVTLHRRVNAGCDCMNDSNCSEGSCYCCSQTSACLIDAEHGIIDLNLNDCWGHCCVQCFEKLTINYVSGDCGHPELIARLATAQMGRQVCCEHNLELIHWFSDFVGVTEKGRVTTTLTELERSNPFGTKRGQIEAYRFLRNNRRRMRAIRI